MKFELRDTEANNFNREFTSINKIYKMKIYSL